MSGGLMSGGQMSGGRLSGGLMSGGLMSAHHFAGVNSHLACSPLQAVGCSHEHGLLITQVYGCLTAT